MRLCAILALAILAVGTVAATATTHTVSAGGGADFDNIWAAVTASTTGDTILVAGGTYTGSSNRLIDPSGKNLVFLADDSARVPVVIDCEGEAHAFRFDTNEDETTIVNGLTILNGFCSNNGGALQLSYASPTFENCSFLDCVSESNGGAIHANDSSATFSDCVFRGNVAESRGGVLVTNRTAMTFTRCVFDENEVVSESYGGGAAYLGSSEDEFIFCTFVENDGDQIVIYSSSSGANISNCIIANSPSGGAVGIGASGVGMVRHCVVYGNADGDSLACAHAENIFHDPLFCSGGPDDYTLCDDSFALEYNNLYNEQIGAYEAGCEPCGTPVEDTTWGRLKALYR